MKCRKAIKQLPAYLDLELSQRDVRELERHVEFCVFCSTELAALRAISKMLDAWHGISPRQCYVHAVLNQIRAEECGVVGERNRIGLRLLEGRWLSDVLRAAAAMVFVIGVTVFSGRVPVEDGTGQVALEKADYLTAARELILRDADLRYSHISPSEFGLVSRSVGKRFPFVKTSSGGFPARATRDGRLLPASSSFPQVNHIYFPEEGMRMESVFPLELP